MIVAVSPETAAAIPEPTKLRVVILPAVPTDDPSSLIDKPSTRIVENPVFDTASTLTTGPTKSSPVAPVALLPLPSDTPKPAIALIVTVAIPAATAASAVTTLPKKLIVEILFAEPTIVFSSRIEIPSIAPAGAEVTHVGAAPAPVSYTHLTLPTIE